MELTLSDVENGGSDDVAGNTTGSSEIGLLGNVDVGDVLIKFTLDSKQWATYLVFTEKGEVEDDFERLSVSSEHDETSHTSVEGFGGFVSSFLQLYHMTEKLVSHQQNHKIRATKGEHG